MDGSSLAIRRIQADQVDAFRRIRLEALRSEPTFYASSYEDWVSLSVDEWQKRLHDPVFVAFRDDEPVGITGLLRQRASKMAHRATIIMVYVRKNLRGTGLARNLLGTVADYARDIGILQLELAVSAENPAAIRFYLREGFSEVGRIPAGFLHDGREIDDVMMVRRLLD
ncbi:ribosomal-protein-alanine acetyltransferase [Agrobacterium sp. DSM 25558]|uniref:GNAT family N-acetyltransferase n=1 Tax=unclassified Agrobacterium TaxID=2632611 RepID=UPI0009725E75|nr:MULTISPECIES: GNAT family N-acetyltransferase [unclassified Agrobacterium]SCX32230.1 ribosomal-protein-alanine acetyltransferase [Agrobacterium sp. DSM 25558]